VLMVSRSAMAARFHEREVRPTGRATEGVRGMALRGDDEVIAADIARDDAELLVLTDAGFGKRTPIHEYRRTKRGALGVMTIKLLARRGKLAGAMVVRPGEQVMLMSNAGTVIRTAIDQIRRAGRLTQGVSVMKPREGEFVSAVARVVESREADEAVETAETPPSGDA
jgi:DNA gyrase subunit A